MTSSAPAPEGVSADGEYVPADAVEIIDAVAFPSDLRLRTAPLTVDDALLLTAHITATAKSLCWLVKEAKDREAWKVLGHPSWDDYCSERLRFSRQRGDQLYAQAVANEAAALAVGLAAGDVNLPEWTLRGLNAEDVAAMAKDVVLSLSSGTRSKRDLAETVERGLRERIAEHKTQVSATTAVASGTETTVTERTTVSRSTTTKTSPPQVPAPGSGDSSGEAQSSPGLPAATSPDDPTALCDAVEGDSATEQDQDAIAPASSLAVGAAPDASPGEVVASGVIEPGDGHASSGSGPVAGEPSATGPTKAQVSRLWAAALELAAMDPETVAALYNGEERATAADDALRLLRWCDDLREVLTDRSLRSVG